MKLRVWRADGATSARSGATAGMSRDDSLRVSRANRWRMAGQVSQAKQPFKAHRKCQKFGFDDLEGTGVGADDLSLGGIVVQLAFLAEELADLGIVPGRELIPGGIAKRALQDSGRNNGKLGDSLPGDGQVDDIHAEAATHVKRSASVKGEKTCGHDEGHWMVDGQRVVSQQRTSG